MSAGDDRASPEIELKFAAEAETMAALRSHPRFEDGGGPSKLTSIYFDTPSRALRQHGYTLRVRSDGRKWLQTIKRRKSATPFVRDEWEVEVAGGEPDLGAAGETPLGALLARAEGGLAPIVTTEIDRTLRLYREQGGLVEVSLDEGQLVSGDKREAISEVELELKEGQPQALFELARALSDETPLRLCLESKSDRGFRLAGDDGLAGLKAEEAVVLPEMTVADAFRMIVRSCLRHIANAASFAKTHEVEGVHQTRVGVRRLRAAASLFRDLTNPDEAQPVRQELKWLAHELNDARDLDVFVGATFEAAEDRQEDAAQTAFRRRALAAQSAAHEKALAAIESQRFARLLLELAAWAETGWLDLNLAEKPAPDFAAGILKDLRKTVRKRGASLAEFDAEERHDFRIEVKKLRYASEFFAHAFGPAAKQRRKFVQRLKKLQEVLGELNDTEVARALALQLTEGRTPEMAFAAGEAVGRRVGRQRKLMEEAAAAYSKLATAKPFWTSVWSYSSSRPTAPYDEAAS
ncbi:MAG TPA: CHAD domain-containing protein [Caulobacteraceae bacterium]|nr:CHAD domain-containing protein [Caulobacteraceae bacterium]